MEQRWVLLTLVILVTLGSIFANGDDSVVKLAKKRLKDGEKVCKQEVKEGSAPPELGLECTEWSSCCCNGTISEFFQADQFDELFPHRDSAVAHAAGFWDYRSFILASVSFQPLGFATTGGPQQKAMELAAFLAHVASRTSCGYPMALGGEFAWGLCYKKELSPDRPYCDDSFKFVYPCAPEAEYYGRGALPLYWNYNYGATGKALKVDLLNHPEYLEQNATLAFQAAILKWMTPPKKRQPSAHQVFIEGKWKPTKNDTLAKRVLGFGTTMNILYGDLICGQGDLDSMNNMISHYKYFLDLLKVGQDHAGTDEVLSCAEQVAFNPSSSSSA